MFKSTLKYHIHIKQTLEEESCDELPTSLVYMDTSVVPHKLLGHVLVEKMKNIKNVVEFDLGMYNIIVEDNNRSIKNYYPKNRI